MWRLVFVVYLSGSLSTSDAQVTFDRRYNTAITPFTSDYGMGLFETEDYYIIFGSNEEDNNIGPVPYVPDTTRPTFIVVDKFGNLINNPRLENNSCFFICNNYTETPDGNFIGVGGSLLPGDTCGLGIPPYVTNSQVYIHKMSMNGELIWKKSFGDTASNVQESAFDLALMNDGNYLILGERNLETWIIKMNEEGDTLWTEIINGFYFSFKHAIEKVDDGFLCFMDGQVLKLSESGDSLWTKNLGLSIRDSIATNDGGFVIMTNESINPNFSTGITKINANADILWSRTYDELDASETGQEIELNNFILAFKDIARIDSSGEVIWKRRIIKDTDWFYYSKILITSDNGLLITGRSEDYNTILTKLDCEGNILWDNSSCFIENTSNILVLPNPFFSEVIFQLYFLDVAEVDLKVYNVLGEIIFETTTNGNSIVRMNTLNVAPGVYFYNVVSESTSLASGKIVKS